MTIFAICGAVGIFAQDSDRLRIVQKFDVRRTVDHQYLGLIYGYRVGGWKYTPTDKPGWFRVEAHYEVASESRRDNILTEKAIQQETSNYFLIDPDGVQSHFEKPGAPVYRNYPLPLPQNAATGSVWTSSGDLLGDFLANGKLTTVPILVEYTSLGEGKYLGQKVLQVKTRFAVRYHAGDDAVADPQIATISGTHGGVVSYDPKTRQPVYLAENIVEQTLDQSGKETLNEGIVLTFYDGVPPLNSSSLRDVWKREFGAMASPETDQSQDLLSGPGTVKNSSGDPNVTVEDDPRGVKLTLNNLKFVADQDTLIPGQDSLLEHVFRVLKSVPGRTILVIGHTAAVGTPKSQDNLAVQRAKSIVERLKQAGIPPQRILYEGRGGRDPIATNETEIGRAQNRRVELLVLDQ